LPAAACAAALLCSASATAAENSPAALSHGESPLWIELHQPRPAEELHDPAGWAEVRGRAGEGRARGMDLVLLLDTSQSTLYPCGRDLDGDGITGELRRVRRPGGLLRSARRWTTDADDTVLRAELEAARRLLRQLDPERARVGLVSFAGRALVRAPPGHRDAALGALDEIRVGLRRGGTDLGAALRTGVQLLAAAPGGAEERLRVLVLLSDGEATAPTPSRYARRHALRTAERAAAAGIRIHTLGLGSSADGARLLAQLAELSGGQFSPLESVGDVVEQLPATPLAGIESVAMYNRSAARAGRAIRVFADGSFDGFVPLVPGRNELEISVRGHSGASRRLLRIVEHAPRAAGPAADLAALRSLRAKLRERSLESALAARARTRQRQLRISLER